jgi:hypothetical protein
MGSSLARRVMSGLLLGATATSLQAAPGLTTADDDGANATPRLAVIVHVDGIRADYLERFAPLLGDGGLARLSNSGAATVGSDADVAKDQLSPAPPYRPPPWAI